MYPKGVKRCSKCRKMMHNCTCVKLPTQTQIQHNESSKNLELNETNDAVPVVINEPNNVTEPIPVPQSENQDNSEVQNKGSNSTSIIAPIIATVDTALQVFGVPPTDAAMQQSVVQMLSACVDVSVVERKTITMQAENVILLTLAGYYIPRLMQSPVVIALLNKLLSKLLKLDERKPSEPKADEPKEAQDGKDATTST